MVQRVRLDPSLGGRIKGSLPTPHHHRQERQELDGETTPIDETLDDSGWQLPAAEVHQLAPRRTAYCVCIPVINEGDRLRGQLGRMRDLAPLADIIIADGGSTDGSTDLEFLAASGVRALLVKTGPGRLSAQLRMGYAYALRQGYRGIITVDGNGKDGVEAIPDFIRELDAGTDLAQGSRYSPGGRAVNTPLGRALAIKLLHAPILSLAAGFRYTDTTSGFRAYSRRLLLHPRVQPFRNVFTDYELLWYLNVKAPRTGHVTREVPITRSYPDTGEVPTKISPWRGNLRVLAQTFRVALGAFDPKASARQDGGS